MSDVGSYLKTEEEIQDFTETFLQDKKNSLEIQNLIQTKVSDLISVKLNVKQLEALLVDLMTIFWQERERDPVSPADSPDCQHLDLEESESEAEDIAPSAFLLPTPKHSSTHFF